MRDVELRVGGEDRPQPVVVVLVDEADGERPVCLAVERVEEPVELVHPPHRRDDEVERRKSLRHAP